MSFDPNSSPTADSGIFGLPFTAAESQLHLIPVPWEVTTSYGDGASLGPRAIFEASRQVDLFDIETGNAYQNGYYMQPISDEILKKNEVNKAKARRLLAGLENSTQDGASHANEKAHSAHQNLLKEVNTASHELNEWVYAQAVSILAQNKIAALIGGDHSTPFGLMRALNEKYEGNFGILHIDAHADLRDAYQGYQFSHASIMHNVCEMIRPKKLVQVGIRDFCEEEFNYIQAHSDRLITYFDPILKRRLNRGENWQGLCSEMVSHLPENVYISLDIDGLAPDLCPNTGTPVPGGLSFDQALMLFSTVAESGRKIVGFDLNEVAPGEDEEDEWDGNVGARLLFKLCGWTMVTNGLSKARTN